MLSEVNAATESGRVAGQIFVWVALLAGALKCWSISRRPATNTKCALSLMVVLLSLIVAGSLGAVMKQIGSSPAMAFAGGILGLALLATMVAAIVLAILGLVEFSKQPDVYSQGRAQAIWTLVLAGVFFLFASVGFIRGLQRAHGFGLASGQSQPGKMLTFDDLNFRFRSPDRPWVAYNASRVNKASKLAFMRRNPEAYFFIIAEKLGSRSGLDTEQLAGLGKANLQAAAASSHVVSEVPCTVKGLNGLLVETEAQVGAYQIHYRHWYCFTNGYAYQLVGFSSSDEQQRVAGELQEMLSRFELIDPNRVASFSNGFTTNYYSARHHYAVMLTNSAWHVFPSLDLKMPLAEMGFSQGDSCLVVVPASLGDEKISTEALVSAFLATLDIPYPNENLTDEKTVTDGDLRGKQFDYSRDINGLTFHYRFKILQGGGEGYLLAAWTQRRASDIEPVLTDAMARVRFLSPTNSFPLLSAGGSDERRAGKTDAYILNQAGLYDGKQGDYELALPLFLAAAKANDQKTIYIFNALDAWQHLDRPREALAFLDTLPATRLALPEVRASQAFFQARASLIDQAVTNYASLFATGYRSDSHLAEYVDLLVELKQYDTALAVVQNYLKAGDSIAAQLLEAKIYRLKKELPQAISLLKELRSQSPFNTQVASALAETFILAGQYSEALNISQDLLRDNGNSAFYEYLKGRSELGLKWYRESKISFAEAVRLAPANKEIRSYLDYVSGLLGEGDNTAIMDPIEPVALPAALTNFPADAVPAGYAKNYGAYYERRIVAVTYEPGREFKTTESMLARLLDASGVSAFSTVQVPFDPLGEQIFVNEVRVMDAGGKTISTGNPANYYVLDDHATKSASQRKVLNIPVPGLHPGCQLAVIITRRQQGRLDEFPFCAHSFSSAVPVRESIFFLGGDVAGLKYHTSPRMEPQKFSEGLCWRVADPTVMRWEPLQPPAASFLPMLWISDASARWPGIVSNYLATISDRLKPDPALRSLTQLLVAKQDNSDAKIALLASYVQTNLIYKAIEFGRRARVPNLPADILRNKYGDCKDHAVLLQQMLVDAGVPAQLALVSHRGPIQQDQPSLDQFDHMIVYVPDAGGGQFLDCTSKGADVAHAIPAGLAGHAALVLDARDPRFVTIPKYPANASSIAVEQHLRVVDQTDLAVEETLTMTGVQAADMRDYLLAIPETSRRTTLQNIMGMADADLTDLQIQSLSSPGEPLRLRFNYSLKNQFHRTDGPLRGVLRIGFARPYLMASPVDNRLTPFEINVPLDLSFHVLVDAPVGFKAVPPEPLDLKLDPRFIAGHGNAQIKDGNLNLNFQCQLKTGIFAAADYAAYRQTMAQALAFIEREIQFKANAH